MPNTNEGPRNKLNGALEFSPVDLGLSAVNLKTATTYTSNLIDLSSFKSFQVVLIDTSTGTGTVGAVNVQIDLFAADGTTAVGPTLLIRGWTLPTAAGTHYMTLTWGHGIALTTITSAGTATGTEQTPAIGPACKCKIKVQVATASDATTAVGSVYLRAGA